MRLLLAALFITLLGGHDVAISAMTGTDPAVFTAPATENQEAQKIAEKLQESRKVLVEAESQKRRILGSLYVINQRMKKISTDKSHLTNELFQVQDNVKSIAKIIANLEVQIEKQRVQLRRRLRALYKLSGQGYIGILFSRESSSDFDETLRFLKIVTDNDYRLIRNYQQNIATYKAQRKKLHGQIERLVGIEKNIKKQEGLLANEHKAKSKIVSEIDKEKIANLNKIRSLRSKTKEMAQSDAALADLLKPSIYEQKGQLQSPIQGTVAQDFGLVVDDKYKIRFSHKGWRFEAAHGASVSAIYDGKVVFADWIEGYGFTVVVDHGDHYYSVYGQIARSRVKTGDAIKKGQVFAEAGPASGGFSEGLYFEIRHFSEPENPANWLLKKAIQQASIAQAVDPRLKQETAP
jgi:septal ring factor EnvC (AmiA/AmiB activator)